MLAFLPETTTLLNPRAAMSTASRKMNDLLNLECPAGISIPDFPSDVVGVSRLLLQVQWVPGRHPLTREHGPLSFEMIFSMSFPAVPPTVRCLTRDFIPAARAAGLPFDPAGRPTLALFSTSSDGVGWSRLCTVTDLLFALSHAVEKDEEPLMRILSPPPVDLKGGVPAGAGGAGSAERQGRRPTMEDVVLTSDSIGTLAHSHGGFPASPTGGSGGFNTRDGGGVIHAAAPSSATVSAVFDGHGGTLASEFCAGHVSNALRRTDPAAVNLPRRLFELLQETDAALASHAASQAPGMGRAFAGAGGFHMAGLPSSPAVSATPPRPTGYVSRTTQAAAKSAARRDTSGATACVVLHIPRGVQGGSNSPAGGSHAMRTVVRLGAERGLSAESGAEAAHPSGETEHGTTVLTSDVDAIPALESVHGGVSGDEGSLVVAHVGDSRAVLWVLGPAAAGARTLLAVELTNDHKVTTRADERARILCAGGIVLQGRVQGRLAVTRALGDFSMKHSDTGEYLVTAEPEMCVVPLHAGCEFVIVACDGLWDVMTSAEAVSMARATLVQQLSSDASAAANAASAAAVQLAESALSRGSSDNVSVVVKILSGLCLEETVSPQGAVGVSAQMVLQAIQPGPAAPAAATGAAGLVKSTPSGANPFSANKHGRARTRSTEAPLVQQPAPLQQPAPQASQPRALAAAIPAASPASESVAAAFTTAMWSSTATSTSTSVARDTQSSSSNARSAVQSLFASSPDGDSTAPVVPSVVPAAALGAMAADSLSDLMSAQTSSRSKEFSGRSSGRESNVRGGSATGQSPISALAEGGPSTGAALGGGAAPVPGLRHARAVGSHRSRRHRSTNSEGGGVTVVQGGSFAPPTLAHVGALGSAAAGVLSAPATTVAFSSAESTATWAGAGGGLGSGRRGPSSGRVHIPTPLPNSGRGGSGNNNPPSVWAAPASGGLFGSIPEGGSTSLEGGADALAQLMSAGGGGSATLGSGRRSGRDRGGRRRAHSPIQPLGGGGGDPLSAGNRGLGGSASESVLPTLASKGVEGGLYGSPAAHRTATGGLSTGGGIPRSSGGGGASPPPPTAPHTRAAPGPAALPQPPGGRPGGGGRRRGAPRGRGGGGGSFAPPPQRYTHQRSASHGRRAAGMPPVSPIQPGAGGGAAAASSAGTGAASRAGSYGRRGNVASNAARRMLG